jgi:hypothetical protein
MAVGTGFGVEALGLGVDSAGEGDASLPVPLERPQAETRRASAASRTGFVEVMAWAPG